MKLTDFAPLTDEQLDAAFANWDEETRPRRIENWVDLMAYFDGQGEGTLMADEMATEFAKTEGYGAVVMFGDVVEKIGNGEFKTEIGVDEYHLHMQDLNLAIRAITDQYNWLHVLIYSPSGAEVRDWFFVREDASGGPKVFRYDWSNCK